ncbi:MAG: hypothetical protein K0R28_626 [Paenibacillus sp.]|nr:hypothetical protein [Paenibacillus sp.]
MKGEKHRLDAGTKVSDLPGGEKDSSAYGGRFSRREMLASMGAAGAAVVSGGLLFGSMGGGAAIASDRGGAVTGSVYGGACEQTIDAECVSYRISDGQPLLTVADRLRVQVSVRDFGAQGDGVTDDTSAIQAAVDYLGLLGGGILWIPQGTYVINATNPTVTSPRRVLITSDNIHIRGIGMPTIKMTGITKAYLDSINDVNSSGRDVFTAFSFRVVKHCSVEAIRFEGEWDGTGTFRYQSPRAKGVGFIGCTDCSAVGLSGYNLLGNLVNATPASGATDGQYSITTGIRIEDCYADRCLENGFNFMGNTFDCSIVRSTAKRCGSAGFEGASHNMFVSHNLFTNNKITGMSISGKNVTVSSNVCVSNGSGDGSTIGNGVTITYYSTLPTSNIVLSDNTIIDNEGFGIQLYTGVSKVRIDGNVLSNNSRSNVYRSGINVVGSAALRIREIDVTNNQFTDELGYTLYTINISYAYMIRLANNTCSTVGGSMAYAQGTASNCLFHANRTNAAILISPSAIDCHQFDNYGINPKAVDLTTEPTTGSWIVGDRVWNKSPSGADAPAGWICTSSGTFVTSSAWTASTVYAIGAYASANSKVYRSVNGGTSGATAPSHAAGTATDGTVIWEYVSPLTTPAFKPFGEVKRSKSGTVSVNGDGISTSLEINHGIGETPSFYYVTTASVDAGAAAISYVTADNVKLVVHFNAVLPVGTGNISLVWKAETA